MIEAKTFDEIDGMLLYVQTGIKTGSLTPIKLVEWLTEIRGELSAYRWVNGTEPPPNMEGQLAMSAAPVLERTIAVRQTLKPVSANLGYTGDLCVQCGDAKMVRNGTCLVCLNCGETTGCS